MKINSNEVYSLTADKHNNIDIGIFTVSEIEEANPTTMVLCFITLDELFDNFFKGIKERNIKRAKYCWIGTNRGKVKMPFKQFENNFIDLYNKTITEHPEIFV